MRCVILESPYSGNVAMNVAYAKRAVLDCLTRNESPIASHLLFTQRGVLQDTDPVQRDLGIVAGHAWLTRCDAVVVYTDFGISSGMELAISKAKELSIPIEYRSLNV